MSPEAIDYFEVAQKQLADADRALKAELFEVAARASYLAALSSARAIIFQKTGNAPKTHSGARAQLSKLKAEGLAIDDRFPSFLAKGFETKSNLDYGPYTPVRESAAETAVATARELLASAKALLARSD